MKPSRSMPHPTRLRRRVLKQTFRFAVCAASVLLGGRVAHAFGAEDLLNGPFHHEVITENAAKAVGFTGELSSRTSGNAARTEALHTLGWNADYIDSYLYSPYWWAADAGLDRFKVSLSTSHELERLHFDDLFSSDQVHHTWRRYTTGTMAGLLWAANRYKDRDTSAIHAAQNIVSVSLHAMQDFYSHSNWVDDPARRQVTYFEVPPWQRAGLNLYTGAYEHEDHLSIKHHGKFGFDCTVMNQPGLKQAMDAACGVASPMAGSPVCESFKACQRGVTVQHQVAGVTVPRGVLYLAPPGIALDNMWMAPLSVQQRGLMGVTPQEAFDAARFLALRQSIAWLQTLEKQMKRVGEGEFWNLVKSTPATNEQREAQFEDYSKFPYQFLSAGPYPPKAANTEEIYLRLRLKTGSSQGAGTDADIRVSTPDSRNTLLDYMPGANPIIAYDDFEEYDDAVYVLGPFSKVPSHITLKNDAPDTGDVLLAFGKSAVEALALLPKAVLGFAEAIIGTHADHIGTSKKVWTPTDLAAVPTAQQAPAKTIEVKSPMGSVGLPGSPTRKGSGTQTITVPAGQKFSIDVNGGSEGHYRVTGYIVKTAESPEPGPQGWREFEVRLHELECVRESKWDRGSDSDEPFLTAVLSPLPGSDQKALEGPYENVNTGNDPNIKRIFQKVRIPKDVGYLNLPVAVWEHDDEGVSTRRELLNRFAGEVEKETVSAKNGLVSALGGSIAAPWQLRHIEVVAWSRNGQVRVGTVLSKYYNKWIDGGGRANFDLNPAAMRTYPITVNDLLANYSGQVPRPTSDPASETPQQGESGTSDKGTGNTRPGPILRPRRPRIQNPRPGTSGGIHIPRRSGSSAP